MPTSQVSHVRVVRGVNGRVPIPYLASRPRRVCGPCNGRCVPQVPIDGRWGTQRPNRTLCGVTNGVYEVYEVRTVGSPTLPPRFLRRNRGLPGGQVVMGGPAHMACGAVTAMQSLIGALRYGHHEGAARHDCGGRGRGDGRARRGPGGHEHHAAPRQQAPPAAVSRPLASRWAWLSWRPA